MECRVAFADMTHYLQTNPGIKPQNIEHHIDESFSSDEYPRGCIVETTQDGSLAKVRWNSNPIGQPHHLVYQICKRGEIYDNQ